MRRRAFLAAAALAGCGGGHEAHQMSLHNFAGSSAASGASAAQYPPDNASFSYSDYLAVSVNSSRARFTRPYSDGQGFEHTNPGARVRFRTDAASLLLRLEYTNLVTRLDTYNATGLVLVNGVQTATFTRAQGSAGPVTQIVNFGSSVLRTIDIVMPYCCSVDFNGVDLPTGATLVPAAARPTTKLVLGGDSIVHGFSGGTVADTWAYQLAVANGHQLVNHGYGGRVVASADGTTMANAGGTVAAYLIGYNNFVAQTALATFKASFTAFVNAFRAVDAASKLYCITPIYSPNTNTLTLEMYRQQIRDALTTLANPLNVLVEGLTIMPNLDAYLADTIHPNDTGSAAIAVALASIVVP